MSADVPSDDLHARIRELEERIASFERHDFERWAYVIDETERLQAELERTHATVSWRVTAPLRAVRRSTRG